MGSVDDAESAIKKFHGIMFKNQEIEVKYSKKSAQTYNKPVEKNQDHALYDQLYDADPFANVPPDDDDDIDKKDVEETVAVTMPPKIDNSSQSVACNETSKLYSVDDLPISDCYHKSFTLFYPFFKEDLTLCGVNICAHHSQYINDLVTLEYSFQKYEGCQGNVKSCDVKLGLLVISKYTDTDWGRACITKLPSGASSPLIGISFIDSGIECMQSLEQLFHVNTDCLKLPKQVGCYKLENISLANFVASTKNDLISTLNLLINGEKVNVVFKSDPSNAIATLPSKSMNLNDYICDKILESNEKMSQPFIGMLIFDLPPKPFPDDETFQICVTEIVSPQLMYANIYDADTIEMLVKVTEKLTSLYGEGTKERQLTPKVNELCVARYQEDQQLYRASVISFNADGTIRVIFIDYGNKADVPAGDIFTINSDLLNFPQLALKFCIAGIQSSNSDGSWSDEVKAHLSTQLRTTDNTASVKRISIQNDKMVCNLSINEDDCAQNLVSNGMAVTPRFMTRDLPRQTPIPITISDVNAFPVYVVNPDELYIWYGDAASVQNYVSKVNTCLTELYGQQSTYRPVEGELCAGFGSGFGEWYRVDILEVKADCVSAKLIDYGNVVDIPFTKLQKLPNEFESQPAQCFRVKINNLIPVSGNTWATKAIDFFKRKVEITLGKMTVLEINTDDTTISFSIEDGDITDVMCSNGHARRRNEPPRTLISDMQIRNPVENEFHLTITHVRDPHLFHGQVPDGTKRILELSKEIANVVSDMTTDYVPVENEVCVGFHDEFQEWYRVHVKEILDGKAKVALTDFGDELEISFHKLNQLPAEFADFPLQAVKCSLQNIRPINGDVWSQEAIDRLRQLTLFQFRTINRDVMNNEAHGNSVNILLEDHTAVTEVLIKERLARSTDVPAESQRYFYRDIARFNVNFNETVMLHVTDIISPTEFYGQADTEETRKLVDLLSADENDANEALVPEKDEVLIGFSPMYEQSLRVRVVEVLDSKAVISCIDLQHEETINTCDLSRMSKEIAEIPQQLLCLGLYDGDKTQWNSESIKYFQDKYIHQTIQLQVKEIERTKFLVSFSTEIIADALTDLKAQIQPVAKQVKAEQKVAKPDTLPARVNEETPKRKAESSPDDTNTTKPRVATSAIRAEETPPKTNNKTTPEKESIPIEPPKEQTPDRKNVNEEQENLKSPDVNSSPQVTPRSPSPISQTNGIESDVSSDSITSPVRLKNGSVESRLPADLHPMDSVGLKMATASLNQATAHVLVRHVISPDLVYVNIASEHVKNSIENLSDNIEKELSAHAGKLNVKAGNFCCVKDEEGKYRRGIISQVTSDQVGVFLIDTGKDIAVSHDDLKNLPNKLKQFAAQVIRIKLAYVKPVGGERGAWSDEVCQVFRNLITDKQLRVKCELRNNKVYYVKMKIEENEQLVSDMLIESGHAEKCEEEKPTRAGLKVKAPIPKKGVDLAKIAEKIEIQTTNIEETFDIIVSCAVSPRLFYGMLWCNNIHKCGEISQQLKDLYGGKVNTQHVFQSGDLCACMYGDDYYRAFVNEAENALGNYNIFLIDYGFKDYVSKNHVWPLPDSFTRFPAQALTFQMQYITPAQNAKHYSDEAVKHFKNTVENKQMVIEVKKTHGFIYRVNMYDKNTRDDMARDLVMRNYAEYLPFLQKEMDRKNNNPTPTNVRSPGRILSQIYSGGNMHNQREMHRPNPRYQENGSYRDQYYEDNYYHSEYDQYQRYDTYHPKDRMRYDEEYPVGPPPPLMHQGPSRGMRGHFRGRANGHMPFPRRGGHLYAQDSMHYDDRYDGRYQQNDYSMENGQREDVYKYQQNNHRGASGDSFGRGARSRGRGGRGGRGRGQQIDQPREQRSGSAERSQNENSFHPSRGRGFPKY